MIKLLKFLAIAIFFSSLVIISHLQQQQLIIVVALASFTLAYGLRYWKGDSYTELACWVTLSYSLWDQIARNRYVSNLCWIRSSQWRLLLWLCEFKMIWQNLLYCLNAVTIILSVMKIYRLRR